MNILLSLAAVMLVVAGGYFTARFRAFYLLHPIKTVHMLPENGVKQMLLSLGGTVGVGNIAGVAVAIMLGGAGAVFWMWVGAFFAMALKYAEITLGMLDKKGACHYIKNALGTLAATLFTLFLIADTLMMGAAIQSNAIAEAMNTAFGVPMLTSGIIVSFLAASIFFFKVDLFRLSALIVPVMSIGYVVMSLCVIAVRIPQIPTVLSSIFQGAFDLKSAAGGIAGIMFTPAMRQGIVKGLFSNEAGCGTAPSAHAASNEKVPARQGLFGIVEVFVDTVVMCTLTALVILLTLGDALSHIGGGGVGISVRAFETFFGAAASPLLAIFIFLFAFSAVISFGYYGRQVFKNAKMQSVFLIVYCIMLFYGAVAAPDALWSAADAVICSMLLINTSAVLVSHKKVALLHRKLYSHMGKYSHNASKTVSRSDGSTKNAIPMSETDIKRGSM